jgi:hypothetical protein
MVRRLTGVLWGRFHDLSSLTCDVPNSASRIPGSGRFDLLFQYRNPAFQPQMAQQIP